MKCKYNNPKLCEVFYIVANMMNQKLGEYSTFDCSCRHFLTMIGVLDHSFYIRNVDSSAIRALLTVLLVHTSLYAHNPGYQRLNQRGLNFSITYA